MEATSRKEKAKQRPLALNTVEMLRVASSSLGMTGFSLNPPKDFLRQACGNLVQPQCSTWGYRPVPVFSPLQALSLHAHLCRAPLSMLTSASTRPRAHLYQYIPSPGSPVLLTPLSSYPFPTLALDHLCQYPLFVFICAMHPLSIPEA